MMPKANQEFLDEQTTIHGKIINAVVAATPEHWDTIVLEVSNQGSSNGEWSCDHTIYNPACPTEVAVPTEEIFDAVYKLVELYKAYKMKMWKSVTYRMWKEDTDWRSKINFEY